MTRSLFLRAGLLASFATLSACAPEVVQRIPSGSPGQPLHLASSDIQQACLGHDVNGGWQVEGRTRYVVSAEVLEVDGTSLGAIVVPGDLRVRRKTTQWAMATPACTGRSLSVLVHPVQGEIVSSRKELVEWRVELGSDITGDGIVEYRGNLEISEQGEGTASQPILLNGREMALKIQVKAGPAFESDRNRESLRRMELSRPRPTGTPLPSERP